VSPAIAHFSLISRYFSLTYQPKQQVFGSNIVMIKESSFINGKLYHFLGAWCQTYLPKNNAISSTNDFFDFLTNHL
jgi:hypothetical protein